jgi:hypothetical protein
MVVANPADHPDDVLDTALTVIDWQGTDEDRARIAHLPSPDLITGRTAAQLAAARRVALIAGQGEPQSLPALLTAQEVLEAHGVAEDAAALVQIEAAAMLKRMAARKPANPRRGTIRRELRDLAGLAVIVAVAWAMLVGA